MNGTCHKIAGITASVIIVDIILPEISLPVVATAVAGGTVGSLFPDIDEPNSIVGKKVKLLSKGIKTIFGHRGIVHTPIFAFLLSILMYFGLSYIAYYLPTEYIEYLKLFHLTFTVGYASHIILDMLTPFGIMVFYPFTKYRFHLIALKGKHRDLFVSTICLIILVLYFSTKYGFITISINIPNTSIIKIITSFGKKN